MRRFVYLFTEEWWSGCKELVTVYGKVSFAQAHKIVEKLNDESPFDYVCSCEFEDFETYQKALNIRVDKGCKIVEGR